MDIWAAAARYLSVQSRVLSLSKSRLRAVTVAIAIKSTWPRRIVGFVEAIRL
jgi:hypothetical protein